MLHDINNLPTDRGEVESGGGFAGRELTHKDGDEGKRSTADTKTHYFLTEYAFL